MLLNIYAISVLKEVKNINFYFKEGWERWIYLVVNCYIIHEIYVRQNIDIFNKLNCLYWKPEVEDPETL